MKYPILLDMWESGSAGIRHDADPVLANGTRTCPGPTAVIEQGPQLTLDEVGENAPMTQPFSRTTWEISDSVDLLLTAQDGREHIPAVSVALISKRKG